LNVFEKSDSIYKSLGRRAFPDVNWLAKVLECDPKLVEKTINEITEKRQVAEAERKICNNLASTGRFYYAQFPSPIELYAAVRLLRPLHVVESGVSSGISSAHILMGLMQNRNGILHSIDFPVEQKGRSRLRGTPSWALPYRRASGWAVPANLTKRWDLIIGKSEERLEKLLQKIRKIDLFCHDSPDTAEHLAFELRTIAPHLNPKSLVIADNTGMNPEAFDKTAKKFKAKVFHRRASSLAAFRIP
jgi:hypothetical protein